jgi:hypothetical protein
MPATPPPMTVTDFVELCGRPFNASSNLQAITVSIAWFQKGTAEVFDRLISFLAMGCGARPP